MKKKIYVALMALPMFVSTLAGCTSLHVHTIDSPWESNETSHWKTCKVCHEKFEEHEHTFNDFNDKCFICDYVDPLVEINEGGEIIRLTKHGKDKLIFNVPHKVNGIPVRGIGHNAFEGSKAVTIKLNEELNYYYTDSFTNSAIRIINTEEDLVKWEQPDKDGKINKVRVLDDNVAMFDNKFYPTLQDAFDAVKGDGATITLLRDELNITNPIEVKHSVSLVSFYSRTNLKCDFNIDSSGILYIPETINYEGNVKLIIGTAQEERATGFYPDKNHPNTIEYVCTSGSLVFVDKEKCPNNVRVSYTHSFGSGEEGVLAHGAKQIVNDAIVALPRKHFAFGTFTFEDDYKTIKGLTKYGRTVNNLNITKVAEYINANIADKAFSIAVRIDVHKDVESTLLNTTKGLFFDLTIGEGIEQVGEGAFNNRADNSFDKETLEAIAPVISHLSSITIGPDVKILKRYAFYGNVYLTSVGGGESLETIGEEAFRCCYNLQSVELSHARKLKKIVGWAFYDCSSLNHVSLPPGVWQCDDDDGDEPFTYFPYDMTPEKVAYYITDSESEHWKHDFVHASDETYPYSCTYKLHVDEGGRYDKVAYFPTLSMAIDYCIAGGEIYISENPGDKEQVIYYDEIDPNLTITAAPGVKNIRIAQNETTDDITIKAESSDKHLILSNVVPKGKIIIEADNNDGVTKHTAGFAISGVSDNNLPEVDLVTTDGQIKIENLVGSESIIRGLTYEHTYGMFNFRVDGGTTYIHDTSPFGDIVQGMTIARQTEEAARVELVSRKGTTKYKNNLVKLNLSSDVKVIGDYFFSGGGGAKQAYDSLEILECDNKGVETIGKCAFEGCDALTSVSLSNTVKTIGEAAFNSCEKLVEVNIPTSLKIIPKQCFSGCSMLETIDIPSSVTLIDEDAFNGDTGLEYITFSEGLDEIGKNAFYNCNQISMLDLPMSLNTIGENAFRACTYLKGVYLPEGNKLATIGANAFEGCVFLIRFSLADNVEGWSAGGTPLDSETLSDEVLAALCLKIEHVNETWQRSKI